MTDRKLAICIITIQPAIELIHFYSQFKNYDIFFMIDDEKISIDCHKESYPYIHFIQIEKEKCMKSGYKHSSYMQNSSLIFNEIIAWDKALFFFCSHFKNHGYEKIWFFEDDVFIYNEKTVALIDDKYPQSDILCRDKNPESKPDEWQWFWPAIHPAIPRPYFHSPICAVRMSKKLLDTIAQYIEENGRMFFIEAMFPSLANYYNLLYDQPPEFSKLVWRRDWQSDEIEKTDFVHPIKDPAIQQLYREKI